MDKSPVADPASVSTPVDHASPTAMAPDASTPPLGQASPLRDALGRMALFAAGEESLPEEANDIHLIQTAVAELLFALRALTIEAGGKALPNDRLTKAWEQSVTTLVKWGEA